MPDDRRTWLRLALAGAAAAVLPGMGRSQPGHSLSPFALGVASGSPTHDSIVLWTRLVSPDSPAWGVDGVTVRWELAEDDQFRRVLQKGQTQALAALGHSVHVEAQGLASDRWYFYRFMAGDAISPAGRTRTFPAPEAAVASLRLAYASCQRWEHGYFSAWRHMREDDPDLVLFLGDYIYEYPGASRPVRMPTGGWVQTLNDYRQRYALYKSEPELQAMHAACPWLVTWDDHEVQNDYAGLHEGQSGEPVADFAARRAAAYQAYYEHMPLRASVMTRAFAGLATGAEMRIHALARYGQLATLYLTDTRQYRDAQACTPGGRRGSALVDPRSCDTWNDPQRSLLGAAQERWLDDAFSHGGSQWNVLAQQTLLGQRNFRTQPQQQFWNDGWDGYPAARQRLIDAMRRHALRNPVVLGGDVHENWVGHVLADYSRPDSASVAVEFCGTSISSRANGNARMTQWLAENPHFIFADAQRKGYGLAEFTPQQLTTSLRVVDDVTRRDTRIETLAQFRVQAGRSLIERV
jgi:alkaline phosphatase D